MSWYWISISISIAVVVGAILWPIMRVPELEFFPRGPERKQALRLARKTVYDLKSRLRIILPMPCLFLIEAFLGTAGITLSKTLKFSLFIILMTWFFMCLRWDKTAMRQAMRQQLANNNRCVSCGYNLQGNESGCCPECGTAIRPPGNA